MKHPNPFLILFFISALVSCRSGNETKLIEESFPVIIEEYSQNKLHHSDTTTLTVRKFDSISTHLFGLDIDGEYETIMDFTFEFNNNDQSQILIGKIPANIVMEKQYSEEVSIRKYFYDIENEADEEGYFFVYNDRIVAYNSIAWNLKRFYVYDSSDISKLLIKDTTDFFYRHKYEIMK